MTKQDLRKEFDGVLGGGNFTHKDYCEKYAYFLEDECIKTENSHQIALNIASKRYEEIDKLDQFSRKLNAENDQMRDGMTSLRQANERLHAQIEGLKRQIKA